jgi:hypothetical protein
LNVESGMELLYEIRGNFHSDQDHEISQT